MCGKLQSEGGVLLFASLTSKFERFEGPSGKDGFLRFHVRVTVSGQMRVTLRWLMCKTSLNPRILSCT